MFSAFHVQFNQWLEKALMRDDVTLFLITSKRDLVVKISREFKRNIVHIEHVCCDYRINTSFTCSRCLICVSRSVHVISTYYARKES